MPVIVVAPKDSSYDKIISNIREVKARKGVIISITDESNDGLDEFSDYSIKIPSTINLLSPLLTTIPAEESCQECYGRIRLKQKIKAG